MSILAIKASLQSLLLLLFSFLINFDLKRKSDISLVNTRDICLLCFYNLSAIKTFKV
nr:MAG TPA: hypothetical protein [Caudoviricetes sp.]